MVPLKQLDRSATVSFCPGSSLLAAGTVAGAIDISFSTNSTLEVGLGGGGAHPTFLVKEIELSVRCAYAAKHQTTCSQPLPVCWTLSCVSDLSNGPSDRAS